MEGLAVGHDNMAIGMERNRREERRPKAPPVGLGRMVAVSAALFGFSFLKDNRKATVEGWLIEGGNEEDVKPICGLTWKLIEEPCGAEECENLRRSARLAQMREVNDDAFHSETEEEQLNEEEIDFESDQEDVVQIVGMKRRNQTLILYLISDREDSPVAIHDPTTLVAEADGVMGKHSSGLPRPEKWKRRG
ncbi:hypothetical protein C2845_PM04G19540 [Panicum miliaceum]|uniref:Uncharacterized protein n=1 Tax=Panicum miliaceum TaxID=4540 RepID=A0A3L6QKR1_PANMI|nr:hypothetical protein C2845_PM04G19540 [Panicum miliaceum]